MNKVIEVDLDKFLRFTLLSHLSRDDTEYYLSVLSDDEKEKLVRLYLDKSIEEAERLLASFQLYIDMGAILYKYRRNPIKGNTVLKEIKTTDGLSDEEIWLVYKNSHSIEPDTGCYLYESKGKRAIVLISLYKDHWGKREWIIDVEDGGSNKKLSDKQKCEVKLEVLKLLEERGER